MKFSIKSTTPIFIMSALLMNSTSSFAKGDKKQNHPNVIYILADDLGIGDLGCYGQKKIKTPAIDKMAQSGILFTQHYSGSTVSAPSRCSLLTGKHTGSSFIRGNQDYRSDDGYTYNLNLPDSEITVAEIFKQKEYKTACIGKWGLGGPSAEGHPNNQGFDYFYGYLSQGNAHRYYPYKIFENNNPVILDKKVYTHDLIVDKAVEFIEENKNNPFFLYLTPTIPHADIIVPNNEFLGYENKFIETPFPGGGYTAQPKPKAAFAAMVSRLDRDIQRIIDLLDENDLSGNTIVVFTSDNGTHTEGGHDPFFFNSNGPFKGIKRDLYEGGIRTPFILKWPDVVDSGSVSYHRSAFWDFLPTVCEILNLPVPKDCDGLSYLPTITNKGRQKKHKSLYFEFHEQGGKQAIIKDEWKLIHLNVNNPNKESFELYNIYTDPGEIANVINQYPQIASKLKNEIKKSRKTNPIWKFNNE